MGLALHSALKADFMRDFHGVATKYLQRYVTWLVWDQAAGRVCGRVRAAESVAG